MGINGFFLSFVSVLPQNILLIPAYLIMGTCAIALWTGASARLRLTKSWRMSLIEKAMAQVPMIKYAGISRIFCGSTETIVSVLPQNILLIPAYLIMGTCAIAFSMRLIRQLFVKRSLAEAPVHKAMAQVPMIKYAGISRIFCGSTETKDRKKPLIPI